MNSRVFEEETGYMFNDEGCLELALTHGSYNKEQNTKDKDNERLEFLGDAFLDAIIGMELFRRMENVTEGTLTKIRALIVCEQSLARVARKLDVGSHLNMGHGEEAAGGRNRDPILADAMEAIIGAVCIDGGYEATRQFVVKAFSEIIDEAIEGKMFSDYKSEVQELLQKKSKSVSIAYDIYREEGPDHDKTFYAHLECNGSIMGSGTGKSKKEAEQNAAKDALEKGAL